jgi:SAM-dependent methyltransferase
LNLILSFPRRVITKIRALLEMPHAISRLAAQHAEAEKISAQRNVAFAAAIDGLRNTYQDDLSTVSTELGNISNELKTSIANLSVENDAKLLSSIAQLRGDISTELTFGLHDLGRFLSQDKCERDHQLEETRSALASVKEVATALTLLRDASAELHSALDKLTAQIQQSTAGYDRRLDNLDGRLNSIDNYQFESRNMLIHNLEGRLNSIDNYQFESRNMLVHLGTSLNTRLDTFQNVIFPDLQAQVHESVAVEFATRVRARSIPSSWASRAEEQYLPAHEAPFEDTLRRAQNDFGKVYGYWRERLDAVDVAFHKGKVGNAAHSGDRYSRIFRSFVEIYARGRVLDVGCGVFGRPYYLASYPSNLISGIDPLPQVEPPDFECVRGISEYLPWPDRSFSTVISATSLDHCLSLDRSLEEISRVLAPEGRFLLWIGSNPGAAEYLPDVEDFVPADQYHLFHFDVSWLDPLLSRSWAVMDQIELQRTGYSHVLYCLVKKN